MQVKTTRAMMMSAALAVAGVGTLIGPLTSPAIAQEQTVEQSPLETRAADVVALIEGEGNAEDVFSDAFLAQVSAETFAQISQQLTAQLGPIVGVESVEQTGENKAQITLRFEKATAAGPMTLSASEPYKIEGLLLNDIRPVASDADDISADLSALPGSAAAWFGPLDGDPLFTYGDPARQYALGSAFKLYVLAALSRAVSEGRLSWDQVVPLDAKSFPSGIMQKWPDGAPVTLQTAATLMISISDNTATDLVLKTVGRDAVEAEMRASGHADLGKTLPFLTTREMFVIKASDLGETYAAAS